jgi:hypothetical protein
LPKTLTMPLRIHRDGPARRPPGPIPGVGSGLAALSVFGADCRPKFARVRVRPMVALLASTLR